MNLGSGLITLVGNQHVGLRQCGQCHVRPAIVADLTRGQHHDNRLAVQDVGSMMIAKNFLQTDVVVIGIILIGVIGFAIEMLMRALEVWLIPWKGKG